uniref:Uncharacterized protein n=1 Tax=Rhizophora mucronata TaxID=61149 RepID=A0A2P2L7C7_RHIMU
MWLPKRRPVQERRWLTYFLCFRSFSPIWVPTRSLLHRHSFLCRVGSCVSRFLRRSHRSLICVKFN